MKLNDNQAKHLTETLRIIAIAQFGFFGYYGLTHWRSSWFEAVWSTGAFLFLEAAAIRALKD